MTTATDELLERARSFIHKHLAEMSEEDRAAVIELLQILDSDDCEEPEEVLDAITEILVPDAMAASLTSDETDEATKKRVAAYRLKVGERIRTLRLAKRWTQDQLAEKSGLPQSHICRLEKGKHAGTHITIEKIAKALGVKPGAIDPGFD